MEYNIIVKADTNDADYVTKITKIKEETLELFRPLFKAIKEYKGDYNWPTRYGLGTKPEKLYKDVVSENVLDNFSFYVPYGEDGVHTIESIELFPYVEMIEKII